MTNPKHATEFGTALHAALRHIDAEAHGMSTVILYYVWAANLISHTHFYAGFPRNRAPYHRMGVKS